MTTFHRPKTYRSHLGCCICGLKSSSSRFTDSGKYESEFEQCFATKERRFGDICNACVLKVKRRRKDRTKQWPDLINKRAGPGSKSVRRIKSQFKRRPTASLVTKPSSLSSSSLLVGTARRPQNPMGTRYRHAAPPQRHANFSGGMIRSESRMSEDDFFEEVSDRSSTAPYLSDQDDDDVASNDSRGELMTSSRRRKATLTSRQRRHDSFSMPVSHFLDPTVWKRKKICCGTIFVGPTGDEVVIDVRYFRPCHTCRTSSGGIALGTGICRQGFDSSCGTEASSVPSPSPSSSSGMEDLFDGMVGISCGGKVPKMEREEMMACLDLTMPRLKHAAKGRGGGGILEVAARATVADACTEMED